MTSPDEARASSTVVRYLSLAFGDSDELYAMSYLALLTTLAYAPPPFEAVVLTDHPERYHWFGDRLTVRQISARDLEEWQGPTRFFWRIKLEALCRGAEHGKHLVYMDSDVLVRRSLGTLVEALERGSVLMHTREGTMRSGRSRTHRRFHRTLAGRTVAGTVVGDQAAMWNAGVVAVPASRAELLPATLAACDELCANGAQHYLTEQFCLSHVLGATGALGPATSWIDHYWGNKAGFQGGVLSRLASVFLRRMDFDEAISFVRANPIEGRLLVRNRWWQKALRNLADSADSAKPAHSAQSAE